MTNKNTGRLLVLSLSMFGIVSLTSAHIGLNVNTDVKVNTSASSSQVKGSSEVNAGVKAEMGSEDTSDGKVYKATSSGTTTGSVKSENNAQNGQKIAADHRSVVANFVLKLNTAADRDDGIGAEVRAIAKEQASTSEKIAVNVEKIQKRNKFWAFLFGSDYKAMGELRSDIKVTENSISRLTNALNKTTNAQVKADLQAQINVLKAEDAKIDVFLAAQTETKGILGWLK